MAEAGATYHPRPLTLVASVPMSEHLAALIGLDEGRTVSGLNPTYTGLTLHISAGSAIVNRDSPAAYLVTFSTQVDVLLTASATNYVFLTYDATIVVNTSGVQPADTLPLFVIATNGSGVTGTPSDLRSVIVQAGVAWKIPGLDLDGNELTNLGAPTLAGSGARLQDVIDRVGLGAKAPVRAATTAAITLSGLQTVDGVSLSSQDRVLVKNQAAGATNGLYVAQSGAWVRATDFDVSSEVIPGTLIPVSEGTVNGDSIFGLDTNGPITLATTVLSFTRRDVKAHEALATAHGAVVAPTPSTMPVRDAAGRFQVADGSAAADVATKGQMDTAVAAEAATRGAADSSEAATRSAADSAEAVSRTNGDAAAVATAEAYAVQRGNHTGTQVAATISDFDAQVRTSRLDQMTAPTSVVPFNGQRISGLADPTAAQDGATKFYVDSALAPIDKAYLRSADDWVLEGVLDFYGDQLSQSQTVRSNAIESRIGEPGTVYVSVNANIGPNRTDSRSIGGVSDSSEAFADGDKVEVVAVITVESLPDGAFLSGIGLRVGSSDNTNMSKTAVNPARIELGVDSAGDIFLITSNGTTVTATDTGLNCTLGAKMKVKFVFIKGTSVVVTVDANAPNTATTSLPNRVGSVHLEKGQTSTSSSVRTRGGFWRVTGA